MFNTHSNIIYKKYCQQRITKSDNTYSLNFNFWFSRLPEVLIVSKCELICGSVSQLENNNIYLEFLNLNVEEQFEDQNVKRSKIMVKLFHIFMSKQVRIFVEQQHLLLMAT